MSTTTTTVLLIRHAHTDAIGVRLSGRAPGVRLSAIGRAQADRLGQALADCPLAAIYSSPLERALETAGALSRHQSVPIHVMHDLIEIEFGSWTGLTYSELESIAAWRRFNESRSEANVPGGERAVEVQERIVRTLTRLAARHPGRTFGVVSHGDVLRYAVAHYTCTPLDSYHQFEIDPASVTILSVSDADPRLVSVNMCS